jgi:hypothetical protein
MYAGDLDRIGREDAWEERVASLQLAYRGHRLIRSV